MVAGLVSEARKLARTRDQRLSENTIRELEDTLEAAVATADAANALRSGRLNVGLTYSGFGSLDLGASLIAESSTRTGRRQSSAPGSAEKPKTRTPSSKGRPRSEGPKTARPQSKDDWSRLKLDLAEAERRVESAEDVVEGTLREANEVQTECHALRGEIVDAARQLRETKQRLEEAERRLVEAKQAGKIAKKEAIRAKSQRNRVEASLHRAMSGES